MNFSKWLNTFVDEKELDRQQIIEVEGNSGTNCIPLQCLLEVILQAPEEEQKQIKTEIVQIDFHNGNVMDFFRHLAKVIAI